MGINGTALLRDATARTVRQWLGVAEPELKEGQIVGANRLACEITQQPGKAAHRMRLTDPSWESIESARRKDSIPTTATPFPKTPTSILI